MGSVPSTIPSASFFHLKNLLQTKRATVGIIGLGYVGLPLANTLHHSGYRVIGYDTDADKISKLSSGISYIHHIAPQIAQQLSNSSLFQPTNDFQDLIPCDAIILCLPTPVGTHNEPDMSYVLNTTKLIADIIHPSTLVVLESTTYPGATDSDMVDLLNESGLKLGDEYFIAYSPEREDPANQQFKTHQIPKLVGGVDDASGILAEILYQKGGFERTVRVSSARVAECAKLLENTYRAVNIALVNELKLVFDSMNVDIWEVLDAAGTKPFGFHRFNPGPGIGGHCIPVDPFYLTWKAKETGAPCSFIELAAVVNSKMPERVVERVQGALNEECKSVKGSKIGLLGIAYKPNVDDIREAPALVIWEKLLDLGAVIKYYDPHVQEVCKTRKHARLWMEKSLETDWNAVQESLDAVVLVTNHARFEQYAFLKGFKGPVIDTRNCIPSDMDLKVVPA